MALGIGKRRSTLRFLVTTPVAVWQMNCGKRNRDTIYGAPGDGDLDTRGLVAVGRQVYMWCVSWSS